MGEGDLEMELGPCPKYPLTWPVNFGFRCCYHPHNTPTQTAREPGQGAALILSNYLPKVQNPQL